MKHAEQVAFPIVGNEENYELIRHQLQGGTFNENTSPTEPMSQEQEMWAQMIWYAVYESTGTGRGKHQCLDCHDDWFEEHPDRMVKRRGMLCKPHCYEKCPCGHWGVTYQQCALNFLNGPDLQFYLSLAGNLNADYLRRLIAQGGVKNDLYTGHGGLNRDMIKYEARNRKRRVVRSGHTI